MQLPKAQHDSPLAEKSPLDRLACLLGDDMKKVNELIIDRAKSDVAIIPRLAGYLIAGGGKRIRPLLTLACARLCGDNGPRPYRLAAAIEFIHTATLLHDDVVDESAERRGNPSANIVYGNQASVLVGDFLFSRAFQLMVEDGSIDVLRILSHASAVIAEGEVMQLATANNIKTTMEDYTKVNEAKTAALFAAACEIGPVIAGSGKDLCVALRNYGHNLGMAFQIADDVLDYTADEKALGKTIGDDFREGKMTVPVILALQDADDGERAFWQRTINDRIQREEDFETALAILKRHKVFAKARDLARQYAKTARNSLSCTPAGDLRDALESLSTYSVEREF